MSRKVSSQCLAAALAVNIVMAFFLGVVQAAPESKVDGWLANGRTQLTPQRVSRLRKAMDVHQRHAKRLSDFGNVIASGTSLEPDGEPCIKVFIERPDRGGIPDFLEGVRVRKQVSSRFYALRGVTCDSSGDQVCAPTERWPLPVPIGVSVGHPGVSAGTAGVRVTDGVNVLLLSNNHILAAANQANPGDGILQPGRADGGLNPDDAIATLTDFEPIDFCSRHGMLLLCTENTIDAAIALSTRSELGVATPTGEFGSDAGYGTPRSNLHPAYGVPDRLGDEDLLQLLGITVQKYARTTGQTAGLVDAINADVDVCYDPECNVIAHFTEQLIVSPGTFSTPGDSGALVVDSLRQPVGLLFAGSDEFTAINRIDLVLNRFGVVVDDGAGRRLVAGRTQDAVTDALYTVVLPAGMSDTPVVMVSPETFDGADTAGLRLRNIGAGGFQVKIEEEQSRDSETAHTSEVVGYLALEPGPIWNSFGSFVGEAGRISSNQNDGGQWRTVTLQRSYSDPVVLMNIATYNGTQPAHIRVRNVTSSSFEYQIEEWDFLDQSHITEDMGYLVLETGSHVLPDGTQIDVGVLQTGHSWANVFFSATFAASPVTLSQSQTYIGEQAVITRQRNITNTGFEVRLQEEEGNDNWHFVETIGYVAVSP